VKKFYWTLSSDFLFKEMPDLNDQHKEHIDRDKSYFTGEPQRKLKQVEGEEGEAEPPADDAGDDEDGDKKELDSDVSE